MKTIQMKPQHTNDQEASAVGGTEGARRATGVPPTDGGREAFVVLPPDPEVPEKKPRRKHTAKYKLRILAQADACTGPGQIGALLRREGLYSSNLTTWRRQKEKGLLQAMTPKKRGRKRKEKNPLANKVAQLERENRLLQQRLKKAETIIEVQKKISEVLEISQNPDDNERSSS